MILISLSTIISASALYNLIKKEQKELLEWLMLIPNDHVSILGKRSREESNENNGFNDINNNNLLTELALIIKDFLPNQYESCSITVEKTNFQNIIQSAETNKLKSLFTLFQHSTSADGRYINISYKKLSSRGVSDIYNSHQPNGHKSYYLLTQDGIQEIKLHDQRYFETLPLTDQQWQRLKTELHKFNITLHLSRDKKG